MGNTVSSSRLWNQLATRFDSFSVDLHSPIRRRGLVGIQWEMFGITKLVKILKSICLLLGRCVIVRIG